MSAARIHNIVLRDSANRVLSVHNTPDAAVFEWSNLPQQAEDSFRQTTAVEVHFHLRELKTTPDTMRPAHAKDDLAEFLARDGVSATKALWQKVRHSEVQYLSLSCTVTPITQGRSHRTTVEYFMTPCLSDPPVLAMPDVLRNVAHLEVFDMRVDSKLFRYIHPGSLVEVYLGLPYTAVPELCDYSSDIHKFVMELVAHPIRALTLTVRGVGLSMLGDLSKLERLETLSLVTWTEGAISEEKLRVDDCSLALEEISQEFLSKLKHLRHLHLPLCPATPDHVRIPPSSKMLGSGDLYAVYQSFGLSHTYRRKKVKIVERDVRAACATFAAAAPMLTTIGWMVPVPCYRQSRVLWCKATGGTGGGKIAQWTCLGFDEDEDNVWPESTLDKVFT